MKKGVRLLPFLLPGNHPAGGRGGAVFGDQKRNIRLVFYIDLGKIVGGNWPSAAAGVLLFYRVALALFARRTARCGVPSGFFFALSFCKEL